MITQRPMITVRPAKPPDNGALADVFADGWRNAYTGIIPYGHLDRMIRARDASWWRNAIRRNNDILVLEVSSVVAGYATLGPSRHRTRHQGEIYELYLNPVYQGLGLGEHLFEACRQFLDVRRLDGLIVWSLADNDAACDFYSRRGGRPVAETRENFGKTQLAKIGFGWQ
jgi:ribosomal protein S18 acetylase RimI-like enzyme